MEGEDVVMEDACERKRDSTVADVSYVTSETREEEGTPGPMIDRIGLSKAVNELSTVRLVGRHQQEGCMWMLEKEFKSEGVRGGVLADDVGLGKTYMMAGVLKANPMPRTLVVTLVNVAFQWMKILRDFADIDSTMVPNHYTSVPECAPSVFVTTYSKIRKRPRWVMTTHWDRIVLDEGHVARNPATTTYEALCQIRGDVRWVLSATPIHNSTRDVLSLFRWVGAIQDQKRTTSLKTLTAEYMMRRTLNGEKQHTKELALREIDDQIVTVDWKSAYERTMYGLLESKMSNCVRSSRSKDERRCIAIEAIMRLRQICVSFEVYEASVRSRTAHEAEDDESSGSDEEEEEEDEHERRKRLAFTCVSDEDDEGEEREEEEEGDDVSTREKAETIARKLADDVNLLAEVEKKCTKPRISSKMRYLCNAIVQSLRERGRDKIIVFCTFMVEMEMLTRELGTRHVSCATLHGGMSNDKRNSQIEQFSNPGSPTNVLVAQIMCSSTGMNLQCANVVFITSPTWNPCIEKQAIGRVHRQGQTKPVVVRRLVMKDSVEERCIEKQSLKLGVIRESLGAEAYDEDGDEGETTEEDVDVRDECNQNSYALISAL